MQWKLYWRNVVRRYRVIIEGWPDELPFKNLSDVSSSFADLESLLRKWRSGVVHWRKISDEEFTEMEGERDHQIEAGTIQEPGRRCRRSDYGTKRARKDNSEQRPSKKHRSRSHISTDEDEA
jgi:hypothetical protein